MNIFWANARNQVQESHEELIFFNIVKMDLIRSEITC